MNNQLLSSFFFCMCVFSKIGVYNPRLVMYCLAKPITLCNIKYLLTLKQCGDRDRPADSDFEIFEHSFFFFKIPTTTLEEKAELATAPAVILCNQCHHM